MDTENALTNAKESPNEIFFEEEARLWAEVYGKQSDKPDLESLQRMLENMNHLLLSLELPWERFIPILYRSFALYMRLRTKIQIIGKPTNCLPNLWTLSFTCHRILT
ncbi:hypothetical protein [Bacteroides thetaiotaomicron]|uniref:hypothetical protein n=1 Tax=Bacteroides thetaiotaomicron TaxID=818 RepID=UPI0039C01C4D